MPRRYEHDNLSVSRLSRISVRTATGSPRPQAIMASMIGSSDRPQPGDGIFRTRREFREDGFRNQTVLRQFFELEVQHTGRRFRQHFMQFAGAHRSVPQFIEDARLPFRIDQTHGQPQRTTQVDGYFSFVHGRSIGLRHKNSHNPPYGKYTDNFFGIRIIFRYLHRSAAPVNFAAV